MCETKICSRCGEEKSIEEYRPSNKRICRKCLILQNNKYYNKNKEIINTKTRIKRSEYIDYYRKYDMDRYNDNRENVLNRRKISRTTHPCRQMWKNAKNRAKKKGLDFNLEESDIVIPSVCPVLGIPLLPNINKEGHGVDTSPSLDRIDNAKGYVKGNVRVISWRANNLKGNGTLEEFLKLIEYLKNPHKAAP
jgi:hypothetical protein